MRWSEMREAGTYILLLAMPFDETICVGALGERSFRAGYYLYVGSALNGLRGRIARHLRHTKRLHWHIDYFLQRARICEIWYHLGTERYECAWARALAILPGIDAVALPFGASDCACPTHLFRAQSPPMLEAVAPHLAHTSPIRRLGAKDLSRDIPS